MCVCLPCVTQGYSVGKLLQWTSPDRQTQLLPCHLREHTKNFADTAQGKHTHLHKDILIFPENTKLVFPCSSFTKQIYEGSLYYQLFAK